MRSPYRLQMYNFLYEVKSTILFPKKGTGGGKKHMIGKKVSGGYLQSYKTLYGRDVRVSEDSILREAREKIFRKYVKSGGKLMSIAITNIYT